MFVDPAHGDYRVKPGSPALALGFKNFPMDQFRHHPQAQGQGRFAHSAGTAARTAIPVKGKPAASRYGGGADSGTIASGGKSDTASNWRGSGQSTWS